MPHISAHLSCLSVPPISVLQCHLTLPVSDAYQCSDIYEYCLSVPISDAYQCHLPVPPHQCPSLQPH
ncbi:unnamed protein product [Staurois parvus]|uniref:Uncharacterized protein n=1 Tax=Staurois parvus TaxID=386267 RepID=A0ABN9EWN1_9NEOB|nr:unnamed protein product [Staurois parvus]